MNCANCSTLISGAIDTFGDPSHPVCLSCWLEPYSDEATPEGGFRLVTVGHYVEVPYQVATCPGCERNLSIEMGMFCGEMDVTVTFNCKCCLDPRDIDEKQEALTIHKAEVWGRKHLRPAILPPKEKWIPGITLSPEAMALVGGAS